MIPFAPVNIIVSNFASAAALPESPIKFEYAF